MAAKPKTETPAPTMADIIRNRAYQIWGVGEETPAKPAPKRAASIKKPVKKASKPLVKKTSKPVAKKAPKPAAKKAAKSKAPARKK